MFMFLGLLHMDIVYVGERVMVVMHAVAVVMDTAALAMVVVLMIGMQMMVMVMQGQHGDNE